MQHLNIPATIAANRAALAARTLQALHTMPDGRTGAAYRAISVTGVECRCSIGVILHPDTLTAIQDLDVNSCRVTDSEIGRLVDYDETDEWFFGSLQPIHDAWLSHSSLETAELFAGTSIGTTTAMAFAQTQPDGHRTLVDEAVFVAFLNWAEARHAARAAEK